MQFLVRKMLYFSNMCHLQYKNSSSTLMNKYSRRRTRRSSSTTCWSCLSQQEAYMKNDLYVHARELNYLYYIQYVTEMIVNTAVVYVVGPRNTFAIHHREARGGNEITARRSSTCNARCAWRWIWRTTYTFRRVNWITCNTFNMRLRW